MAQYDTTQRTSGHFDGAGDSPDALTGDAAPWAKSVGAGMAVCGAGFAAVLAEGFGWAAAALVLGGVAVVAGFVQLFTAPRAWPGAAWTLTGVLVGAAALLLVLLFGTGSNAVAPLPVGDGGVGLPIEPPPETTVPETWPVLNVVVPTSVNATSTAPDSTDNAGSTVSFSADNLVDGDLTTAWRVPGDGSGQGIIVGFAGPTHLRRISLTAGYTKVDPVTGEDRFPQNRRLERVTFLFGDGSQQEFTLDSTSQQLQDIDVDVTTSTVGVRIDATTDAPLDFAAVSEIRFWAQD